VLTFGFLTDVDLRRLAIIAAVAVTAHIVVVLVRAFTRWLIASRLGSINKAQTLTRFFASVVIFVVWFIAVGVALYELGVPLQTYLASATIIGLAVSFGSQSLVQDVISGLTLIFGGLLDVGDMVEIAGQTGVIERIGIRYTVLRNFQGAVIYIPNRNVANFARFPLGYVRAFVDVRLPADETARAEAERRIRAIAESAHGQFTGVLVQPPAVAALAFAGEGGAFLRVKFRIWPGQVAVIESTVRQRIIQSMRDLDSAYQDWMVAVHYRIEPGVKRRAASMFAAFRKRSSR
jgi:moderate conductance mechanosensitive channel